MRKRTAAIVTAAAALGLAVPALGASGGSSAAPASRLDDGKALLSQAGVTEQQAIDAAQSAASGKLNEVDLERRDGMLVFNVDVGVKDVKVNASNGAVVSVDEDD
jgi:uncharacterized membrane protein YkoI